MPIFIQEVPPIAQYAAAEDQTSFAYPFPVDAQEDLLVWVDDQRQDSTAYTVTGAGDDDGGTVEFATPPRPTGAPAVTVTINRQVLLKRVTDFPTAGRYYAEALNRELNRLVMALQEMAYDLGARTYQLPAYTIIGQQVVQLPQPEPGKFLRWNADGSALINSDGTIEDFSAASNPFMDAFLASDNASQARTVLVLGAAALRSVGTGAGQIPDWSMLGEAARRDVGTEPEQLPPAEAVDPDFLLP